MKAQKAGELAPLIGAPYLHRLAFMSIAVACLVAAVFHLAGEPKWATGVIAGALWAVANLYMVRFLVVRVVRSPEHRTRDPKLWGTVLGLLIKFPLLYGAGFWLLQSGWFRVEALVLGFVVPFGAAFAGALMALVRLRAAQSRAGTHEERNTSPARAG